MAAMDTKLMSGEGPWFAENGRFVGNSTTMTAESKGQVV